MYRCTSIDRYLPILQIAETGPAPETVSLARARYSKKRKEQNSLVVFCISALPSLCSNWQPIFHLCVLLQKYTCAFIFELTCVSSRILYWYILVLRTYIQILFIMQYFINMHTNSFHYAVFRNHTYKFFSLCCIS